MRVCHLCARFSPVSETFIYDYIRTLPELRAETMVVTSQRENPELFPMEPVVVIPDTPRWSFGRAWARLAQRSKRRAWPHTRLRPVLDSIGRFGADLLHAHFGHVGASSLELAREARVPLVVSFHGRDAFKFPREPRWRHLYREMFESGARFTGVSEYMRQEMIRLGCLPDSISVVHVGIDPALFEFREPRTEGSPVRFVSVGRMVEKKGFSDCVRAFGSARARGADIELSIIGDGPERARVQELADSLGVRSSVSFLGQLARPQVIEAMRSSDAFILASRTAADGDKEGIPTVLMEAEFIGLPIVSTTHSGIPEAIPEPNRRFLAPEGDPQALADRIVALLGHRSSWRDAAHLGKRHVEAHFNLLSETEKLVEAYSAALDRACACPGRAQRKASAQ